MANYGTVLSQDTRPVFNPERLGWSGLICRLASGKGGSGGVNHFPPWAPRIRGTVFELLCPGQLVQNENTAIGGQRLLPFPGEPCTRTGYLRCMLRGSAGTTRMPM
jgi:hypothetical protein